VTFSTDTLFGSNYDEENTVDIDGLDMVDPGPSPLDMLLAVEALSRRPEGDADRARREAKTARSIERSEKLAKSRKFRINTPDELRWDREIARIRMRCTAPVTACELCESTAHVERHHDSYLKPQEVICLCRIHHKARHSRLLAQGRDPYLAYFEARRSGTPAPAEADLTDYRGRHLTRAGRAARAV
jgi:hypothetical protein